MSVRPQDPRSRPARGTGDVLVTGATGRLGHAVVQELVREGVAARLLVRPGRGTAAPSGPKVWIREGAFSDGQALRLALEGVRTVFHLAGVVRSADPVALVDVHERGTAALVRACEETGVERIVAVSSDTVGRIHKSAYAQSKGRMEAILSLSAVPCVVLRPPMILGPGSPHLASLVQMARLPVLPWPGDLPPRAPVRVEDVARVVLDAGFGPDPGRDPILLPGAEALQWTELVGRVAEAMNRPRPKVVSLPARALLPWLERGGSGPLATLAERLRGLFEDAGGDTTLADGRIGWNPGRIDVPWLRTVIRKG